MEVACAGRVLMPMTRGSCHSSSSLSVRILRDMERELGISYPTVRNRVEALVRALGLAGPDVAVAPDVPGPAVAPAIGYNSAPSSVGAYTVPQHTVQAASDEPPSYHIGDDSLPVIQTAQRPTTADPTIRQLPPVDD